MCSNSLTKMFKVHVYTEILIMTVELTATMFEGGGCAVNTTFYCLPHWAQEWCMQTFSNIFYLITKYYILKMI